MKELVNITHYIGVLVKFISIHLMISSNNIFSCVRLLFSATKHIFFNFIVETLISVNSLHCLRRKMISWTALESFISVLFSYVKKSVSTL